MLRPTIYIPTALLRLLGRPPAAPPPDHREPAPVEPRPGAPRRPAHSAP